MTDTIKNNEINSEATKVDRFNQTNINIQEKASLIWSIADKALRGIYQASDYEKVILPFTVIKRFHDTLEPTRKKVLKVSKQVEEEQINPELADTLLKDASGYEFYNTSEYNFDLLLADSENIYDNFLNYINGFSDNVQDVLSKFKLENELETLEEAGVLFLVIQEFNSERGDFSPSKVSNEDMGYVFEELVRRFFEDKPKDSGEFFTSRDIIYLMTDILLATDSVDIANREGTITVYDQAMGTSQMLSCMEERIKTLDADARIQVFGQERNAQTYAIAKSDMLIRGGDAANMRFGDTLDDDQFENYTFDYCISNPPFGSDFEKSQKFVQKEHEEKGYEGRFGPGIPRKSDGQLLFTMNGLDKLKEDGRMAIIHNGSALFTGNPKNSDQNTKTGSESLIRQWVIESDYVDAIIQLPNDLFYNTGIATYIWIYDKNKPKYKQGKIQLIDASKAFTKRRKSLSSKRVDLAEEDRALILKAYDDYKEDKIYEDDRGRVVESRIFPNEFFGFTRVTIQSPKRDENGEILRKKNGKPKADSSLKDEEDIPLTEDIEDYFQREVKPFNPDAWMDRKKNKTGYEIPFTRVFYKYKKPESSEVIAGRIKDLEEKIVETFEALSGKDVDIDD